jgi:small basic protein
VKSVLKGTYDNLIFVTGFIGNAMLAINPVTNIKLSYVPFKTDFTAPNIESIVASIATDIYNE